MTRRDPPDSPPAFFETVDDHLAAYLLAKGRTPSGLGLGEGLDAIPLVTHLFDAPATRLHGLVSAYRDRSGDTVSASAFVSALLHLRTVRMDETMRRLRQVESDLAKVRLPSGDEGVGEEGE